jgi:hypothetical protein
MQAVQTKKQLDPGNLSVEERIRTRAYELYVLRGSVSGSELEDWLQAEEEVLAAQDRHIEELG